MLETSHQNTAQEKTTSPQNAYHRVRSSPTKAHLNRPNPNSPDAPPFFRPHLRDGAFSSEFSTSIEPIAVTTCISNISYTKMESIEHQHSILIQQKSSTTKDSIFQILTAARLSHPLKENRRSICLRLPDLPTVHSSQKPIRTHPGSDSEQQ